MSDLLNTKSLLGKANADLSLARSNEVTATMSANAADRRARNAAKEAKELKQKLDDAEKESLGWEYTNTAFKFLARKYGALLNITDAQRQQDFDAIALALAEQETRFKNTQAFDKILARSARSK